MSAAVTVTPSTPQAGQPAVISGTGFTAGQVVDIRIIDPQYGSNLVAKDRSTAAQSYGGGTVTCDATGAFTFPFVFGYGTVNGQATYTVQVLSTSPVVLASTTASPSAANN